MVVRRILPLQRRPHLVCLMSGRLDPCRLSVKRLTSGSVARRVNLISTAPWLDMEAEDADEDTASAAERSGWAAADAADRELEAESK
ncbi:hypothetical protein D1007_62482 [Hordeum vulgare]|nr:hypothetical protein D1007_62482 [Hordeum vulgare]